jgi:hypothetical protein
LVAGGAFYSVASERIGMAITAAVCTSYLQEILQGTHSSADTYKIALYPSTATLSAATTAYSSTGEVTGTGYTAGGATLSGFSATIDTGKSVLDFTTDPTWASSTITARGALIYNSTKANRSVVVLDFGADITSTNGTFTVTFPAATAANGLVRLG